MANDNVEDSPELPDTAPMLDEEQIQQHYSVSHWGKLIQLTSNGSTRVLTEEFYRVGRAPSCELAISEHEVGPKKYTLISKVHFKLVRYACEDESAVFLEDLSSNGTFVNDRKVGRNNKVLLENGAEISLASPNLKMYLYIDKSNSNSSGNWLPASIASQFHVLKPLGTGTFGDVRLVIDQQTNEKYAMKKILKDKMSENKIFNEVNILKRLKHPSIVHLEGVYDTPEAVYITLEYVSGGNLLNRIVKLKRIPESECKSIFYQLLLGVEYLHKEGITHRDLKPENILLEVDSYTNDVIVKITDFGLSKVQSSKSECKTMCGTMKYIAPEVLAHFKPTYDNKVDIWSLGVILFVCLSGQHPFSCEDNTAQLAQEIMSGKYKMCINRWQLVSKYATQMVKKMLVVDPRKRINVSELFQHPWLKDDFIIAKVNNLINEKSIDDLEPELKRQKICN